MERPAIRLATHADTADIQNVMTLAIRHLQAPFLNQQQIAASIDIMGLDAQLIDDGTYYVAEHGNVVVGSGGWSRRATLYGGHHSANRDATLLDPDREPARIRAMYTHPEHTRRGIARLILETCETVAVANRFRCAELVATLSGEPLYRNYGYSLVEDTHVDTHSGVTIPVRLMRKSF